MSEIDRLGPLADLPPLAPLGPLGTPRARAPLGAARPDGSEGGTSASVGSEATTRGTPPAARDRAASDSSPASSARLAVPGAGVAASLQASSASSDLLSRMRPATPTRVEPLTPWHIGADPDMPGFDLPYRADPEPAEASTASFRRHSTPQPQGASAALTSEALARVDRAGSVHTGPHTRSQTGVLLQTPTLEQPIAEIFERVERALAERAADPAGAVDLVGLAELGRPEASAALPGPSRTGPGIAPIATLPRRRPQWAADAALAVHIGAHPPRHPSRGRSGEAQRPASTAVRSTATASTGYMASSARSRLGAPAVEGGAGGSDDDSQDDAPDPGRPLARVSIREAFFGTPRATPALSSWRDEEMAFPFPSVPTPSRGARTPLATDAGGPSQVTGASLFEPAVPSRLVGVATTDFATERSSGSSTPRSQTEAYFRDLVNAGQRDMARMAWTVAFGAASARGAEALIHTGIGKLLALSMEAEPILQAYGITDPLQKALVQAALAATTIAPLHYLAVTGIKPAHESALGAQVKPIKVDSAFPPTAGGRRKAMKQLIDALKPGQFLIDSLHYASFVLSSTGRAGETTDPWKVAMQSFWGGYGIGGIAPLIQLMTHLVEEEHTQDAHGQPVTIQHRFPTHALEAPWTENPLTVGWKSLKQSSELRGSSLDGRPGPLLRSRPSQLFHDVGGRWTGVFLGVLLSQAVINTLFRDRAPDGGRLVDRLLTGPLVTAFYLLMLTAHLAMHGERKPGQPGSVGVVRKMMHPLRSTAATFALLGTSPDRPLTIAEMSRNGVVRLGALLHLHICATVTLPAHLVRDVPLAAKVGVARAGRLALGPAANRVMGRMLPTP